MKVSDNRIVQDLLISMPAVMRKCYKSSLRSKLRRSEFKQIRSRPVINAANLRSPSQDESQTLDKPDVKDQSVP